MAESFDPYAEWLGIALGQRPPTNYQLLGVAAFENEAGAIEAAAAERKARVLAQLIGPRAALARRMLSEISMAEGCLLDPETKAAYDEHLRPLGAAADKSSAIVPERKTSLVPKSKKTPLESKKSNPPALPVSRMALPARDTVSRRAQVDLHDDIPAAKSAPRKPARTLLPEDVASTITVSRRMAVGLVGAVAVLAVAGAILCVYWNERNTVHEVSELIAAGKYEKALLTLGPFRDKTYFHGDEASYLYALASMRRFSSAVNTAAIDKDALKKAAECFEGLFRSGKTWRARARKDLAATIALVPNEASDALSRSLTIARFLHFVNVAEPVQLAQMLVEKAQEQEKFHSPVLDAKHSDYVARVLEWAPALAEKVVELALPTKGNPEVGLATIKAWSIGAPVLAVTLSSGVSQVAGRRAKSGEYADAELFVDAASLLDPRYDTTSFWEKQFQQKVKDSNLTGAVSVLACMVGGRQDAAALDQATRFYVDLASRYPAAIREPPPEIRRELQRREFDKLIADAEHAGKNGQYQAAMRNFDEARIRFPTFYDAAQRNGKFRDDEQFFRDMDEASKRFDDGDLNGAKTAVDRALGIRPDEKVARDLQGKIHQGLGK